MLKASAGRCAIQDPLLVPLTRSMKEFVTILHRGALQFQPVKNGWLISYSIRTH
jgi:hypothetical protein